MDTEYRITMSWAKLYDHVSYKTTKNYELCIYIYLIFVVIFVWWSIFWSGRKVKQIKSDWHHWPTSDTWQIFIYHLEGKRGVLKSYFSMYIISEWPLINEYRWPVSNGISCSRFNLKYLKMDHTSVTRNKIYHSQRLIWIQNIVWTRNFSQKWRKTEGCIPYI